MGRAEAPSSAGGARGEATLRGSLLEAAQAIQPAGDRRRALAAIQRSFASG